MSYTVGDYSVKVDEDGILYCPLCDFDYLHQKTAMVIFRRKEDGDGIISTSTKNTVLTEYISANQIKNRRDNLYIRFECEGCLALEKELLLQISQHKGRTFLSWVKSQNVPVPEDIIIRETLENI